MVKGGGKMGSKVKVMVRNGGFEVGRWYSSKSRDFGKLFCHQFFDVTQKISCHLRNPDVTQRLHKIHNAGRNYESGQNYIYRIDRISDDPSGHQPDQSESG